MKSPYKASLFLKLTTLYCILCAYLFYRWLLCSYQWQLLSIHSLKRTDLASSLSPRCSIQ